MSQRLLVPLDGSPQSREALQYAIETFSDAEIVAVHVLNPTVETGTSGFEGVIPDVGSAVNEQEEFAEELFAEAREVAGDRLVDTDLLTGRAARSIVEYATEHPVDGIVMGSHGRDGAARLLLGSVSETVVRRSPVPVTVVR
ncbi:MAG: universal stress protein [Halohasta sp.]